MITWILLGVTAIVLVAVIVRLLFGGRDKGRTPPVFGSDSVPKDDACPEELPYDSTAPVLVSESGEQDKPADFEQTSIHSVTAGVPDPVAVVGSAGVDQQAADVSDKSEDSGSPTADAESVDSTTVSRYPSRSQSLGRNRLTGARPSIFSDFRGIVQSDESLPNPDPEDLPIHDDDLTFGRATPALAQMLPESASRKQKQRQDLATAGYHTRAAWLNLNATRFVLAFLALVAVGCALLVAPPAAELYLLAAVLAAPLVGWALPPLLVASKAAERKTDIERGLPDALDMLNMGVSQGLTVESALKRIGPEIRSAHPALADELKIVDQQTQMGSLRQALHNFAKRIDSAEVTSFTSLLIQSEATGTSVTRALTEYSDSMRSTFRERADARANAASFKLLFPTVLCLLPSVFLFLLGPPVVSMSDFFGGTATELIQGRDNAINSLDQAPRVIPEDAL